MADAAKFVCEPADEPAKPQRQYPEPPDIFCSAEIPDPIERPLKVYAFDPSAGRFIGNYMTVAVRYEELTPGPAGASFAVIDYDGRHKTFYKPVDLDNPKLLISGGLPPSESDPRFHQQMVYAVACETVQRFEYALGRRIHWRGTRRGAGRRLNLYPHAMCEANAFYSREANGVLFGYFKAARTEQGRNLPGQTVYTCLSHDIIAHEVTHAIVDSIREYFMEPTNVDVSAFHEAFADLAALFSHFAHKEALLDTLQKTGGRLFDFKLKPEAGFADDPRGAVIQAQLSADNPLIALAVQFGQVSGKRLGLRSALGTPPNSDDIRRFTEPHDRGSILVAAVFDAYFTIYTRRTFDLFRIFRAGGGSITQSDLPVPLANQLASEASRTAEEFFVICARALDYCPPVDITFGDFLRAVLTAHLDLNRDDPDGVRPAFMEAFRLRGIYADGAASFSEESLFWPRVDRKKLPPLKDLLFGDPNGLTKDEKDQNGKVLREYAEKNASLLGFDPEAGPISVSSFHPMFHPTKDGSLFVNMVVELVQTVRVSFNDGVAGDFPLRNGVTLLIAQEHVKDDQKPDAFVLFAVLKQHTPEREERIRNFLTASGLAEKVPGRKQESDDARFEINFGLLHAGI
jgi:hypothetical protein